MTDVVILRDSSKCCMDPTFVVVDNAYIIPKAEKPWFRTNGMSVHNGNPLISDVIMDTRNGLSLGVELHRCWDLGRFTFVPKEAWAAQLCSFYHNVQLRVPVNFSAHFYYARFAWAIFLLVRNFFEGGTDHLTKVKASTTIPEVPSTKRQRTSSHSMESSSEDQDGTGNNGGDATPVVPNDTDEFQKELEFAREHFGADMKEKEWSSSYVFQHINWYPGLNKALPALGRGGSEMIVPIDSDEIKYPMETRGNVQS
ncbi:hypothetical protein FRB95_010891 [Tulasnella sp. JGI-2019a]|nr:hypothetical protein FRB95_010891 [Tulasnella sp. JGI-2019a]